MTDLINILFVTWGAPLEGGVFRRGRMFYVIHLLLGSTYAEVITGMFCVC